MKLTTGMHRALTALVLFSLMPLISGCESIEDDPVTGRAWDANMNSVYRPAPHPNVQFFQKPDLTDVLVRYDEEREKTGAARHRAYFVLANESRTLARQKPRFVRPSLADSMRPVPFTIGTNRFPAPLPSAASGFLAVLSIDGLEFTLFRDGRQAGSYSLPVYVDRRSQFAMLMEAPGTLTVDAVVVCVVAGGIVGLIYLEGLANSSH
jgi:hypothetical protein